MKFIRQFAAVLVVVAVIVMAGVIWQHAVGAASPGGGRVVRGDGAGAALRQKVFAAARDGQGLPGGLDVRRVRRGGRAGLDLQNLVKTCVIEVLVMSAVIGCGVARHRRRRTRRHRTP